jgi:hypothetical protein
MGYGGYSTVTRSLRSSSLGYDTKTAGEIFSARNINNAMSPHGIEVRESRDSDEHPNSVPLVLALDVTGSMGPIPHFLVKEGLPKMMEKIINAGVPDPQVLFLGIGDHACDSAPLQVGQFESSDALLDHWLTKLYLEGGGGGNNGESYLLAWFFASKYVKADHIEKRHKKGIIITIGDEPTLGKLPAKAQKKLMGDKGKYEDLTAAHLLKDAQKKFECFHLHLLQGSAGMRKDVKEGWTKLMGDNVLFIQNKESVAQLIADKVVQVVKDQKATLPPTRFDDLVS